MDKAAKQRIAARLGIEQTVSQRLFSVLPESVRDLFNVNQIAAKFWLHKADEVIADQSGETKFARTLEACRVAKPGSELSHKAFALANKRLNEISGDTIHSKQVWESKLDQVAHRTAMAFALETLRT